MSTTHEISRALELAVEALDSIASSPLSGAAGSSASRLIAQRALRDIADPPRPSLARLEAAHRSCVNVDGVIPA